MSTKALNQCQWEYREKGCIHEYVNWRVTFVEFNTKESGTELCIRMCSYMFSKRGVSFTMVKHPHLTLNVSRMLDTTTSPTYFPAAHRVTFSVVPPGYADLRNLTLSLAIRFPTSPAVCFPEHFWWCVLALGGWWFESLKILTRLSCFD